MDMFCKSTKMGIALFMYELFQQQALCVRRALGTKLDAVEAKAVESTWPYPHMVWASQTTEITLCT